MASASRVSSAYTCQEAMPVLLPQLPHPGSKRPEAPTWPAGARPGQQPHLGVTMTLAAWSGMLHLLSTYCPPSTVLGAGGRPKTRSAHSAHIPVGWVVNGSVRLDVVAQGVDKHSEETF